MPQPAARCHRDPNTWHVAPVCIDPAPPAWQAQGMRKVQWLALSTLLLCACVGLQFEPGDGVSTRLGKGVVRVPQALFTLGYSEMTYATDRRLSRWIGLHRDSLISKWGQPLEVHPGPDGGEILVFADRKIMPRSVNGTIEESTAGGVTEYRIEHDAIGYRDRVVFRVFDVDSRGVIQGYLWRGL